MASAHIATTHLLQACTCLGPCSAVLHIRRCLTRGDPAKQRFIVDRKVLQDVQIVGGCFSKAMQPDARLNVRQAPALTHLREAIV